MEVLAAQPRVPRCGGLVRRSELHVHLVALHGASVPILFEAIDAQLVQQVSVHFNGWSHGWHGHMRTGFGHRHLYQFATITDGAAEHQHYASSADAHLRRGCGLEPAGRLQHALAEQLRRMDVERTCNRVHTQFDVFRLT